MPIFSGLGATQQKSTNSSFDIIDLYLKQTVRLSKKRTPHPFDFRNSEFTEDSAARKRCIAEQSRNADYETSASGLTSTSSEHAHVHCLSELMVLIQDQSSEAQRIEMV